MKKIPTNWLLAGGIAIVMLTITLVLFVSIRQTQRVNDTTVRVAHTELVLHHIQKLEIAALDNETGARGYVITGKESFLPPIYLTERKFEEEIKAIQQLVTDNPQQSMQIVGLRKAVQQRIDFSRLMIHTRNEKGLDSVVSLMEEGKGKMYTDQIRKIGNEMETAENKLLLHRKEENDRTISTLNVILYVVLVTVLLLSVIIISQLKRHIDQQSSNEKKFSALLDAAPDATVIVDKGGIIRMINQQTENLFGYARNEMIGQPVEILVPADIRSKHNNHRNDFFSLPKVRSMGVGMELNAVKKDGSLFPVEISLSPIDTVDGLLVSASVRDITQRKKLENELKKTNAELEAFTYSVSHDLRAPLRGIIGFTAILEEDYSSKLDEEARRVTGIIRTNTLRMGHLVDDLLAFSRMGRQELVKTKVNMQKLVKEVMKDMQLQTPQCGVRWLVNDLPEIKADLNTIRQVWVNLISNAIKYSSGRTVPEIGIGYILNEGDHVFYVKDNGVGFDNKYRNKLFRVFQRLHSAEEFEGTGVGLALVEKIVSRHGGKVWAEGEVNKGACFYFSLPAD